MLCGCGCGKETKIWTRTRGAHKRGESQAYVRGHWNTGKRRTDIPEPNPSGICQCGCGLPAPIATMTNEKAGHIAGKPVKFIRGHVGYLKVRTEITPNQWREENRGYKTLCRIWNGPPQGPAGYCRVILNGRQLLAHRAMYEQEIGPIPGGLDLDHLCRQPSCVNPSHLDPVPRAVNIRRGIGTKLTDDDVCMIRESMETQAFLASRFGVSQSLISMIKSGKRWAE